MKKGLKKIACKYCSDYPTVKENDALEDLWAIESTLWGTNKANGDLHKFIKILGDKFDMMPDQLYDLWEENEKEQK